MIIWVCGVPTADGYAFVGDHPRTVIARECAADNLTGTILGFVDSSMPPLVPCGETIKLVNKYVSGLLSETYPELKKTKVGVTISHSGYYGAHVVELWETELM